MGCGGGRVFPLGAQSCLEMSFWLETLGTRGLEDRCAQLFGGAANEDTMPSSTALDRRE